MRETLVVGQFENHRAVTTGAASHRSLAGRRLGATLRTIYHGGFDTMDRGEERKAAEVVTALPDRKLTHHRDLRRVVVRAACVLRSPP